MSDQTINQLRAILKEQNAHLKHMRKALDQLDMLVHYQKHLVRCTKSLSFQYDKLVENMNYIDVAVFEIRMEFEKVSGKASGVYTHRA